MAFFFSEQDNYSTILCLDQKLLRCSSLLFRKNLIKLDYVPREEIRKLFCEEQLQEIIFNLEKGQQQNMMAVLWKRTTIYWVSSWERLQINE